MDQELLVGNQIHAGSRLARDLMASDYPVTDVAWSRFEDTGAWQLEIITPLVDDAGRRAAYLRMFEAIEIERYPEIDFEHVVVRSPSEVPAEADFEVRGGQWITSRAKAGLAVAGAPIERISYGRDPAVYEAKIWAALRQIAPADAIQVNPRTSPRVDFLLEMPNRRVAIEAKVKSRVIDTQDIIYLVGLSTLLSTYVVMVTPNEIGDFALSLLERAGNQVSLVRWTSSEDNPALATAIGLR